VAAPFCGLVASSRTLRDAMAWSWVAFSSTFPATHGGADVRVSRDSHTHGQCYCTNLDSPCVVKNQTTAFHLLPCTEFHASSEGTESQSSNTGAEFLTDHNVRGTSLPLETCFHILSPNLVWI
jgi:hypothetical protein